MLPNIFGLAFMLLGLVTSSAFATTVRMQTSLGDIDIQLMDEAAPATVSNFLAYVASGAYVNSFLHRSVPGFIIQGGGYRWSTASNGVASVAANPAVINEYSASRSNLRGTIAMAKLGSDPNSATNQWFFNLANNSANLDHQNGGFTVFGQVTDAGLQVVDAIAALPIIKTLSAPFDTLPLVTVPSGAITSQNLVMITAVSVVPESADIRITLNLVKGWNLVGNGTNASIAVASLLNDAANISSVWTWQASGNAWAFYAPGQAEGGLTYAQSRGYAALTSIGAGDGFWINALQDFALHLPTAAALTPASFTSLAAGWHLISIGVSRTPSAFSADLSAAPGISSLWAWDNVNLRWFFYAPSLAEQGSGVLTDYIAGKGYRDFTAAGKTLAPGTGFWVHKP